ncbi:MAG TPA: response regulator [Minicystis sp.]|nr:response regulator [Minicystis sp.]
MMQDPELELLDGWIGALGRGFVLWVAAPEAFHAPLCPALEALGFAVVLRSTLAEAFDAARETPPCCIVCDADLRDGTGLEIGRLLREHADLADVPLAFVTADTDRRIEALACGDCALRADMRPELQAAQIDALCRLAERLEGSEARAPAPHAMTGDAAAIPLATVLSVLGLERHGGILEAVGDGQRAHLEIVEGRAVEGVVGEERVAPLSALRTMLGWTSCRFAFTALPLVGTPPDARELAELCVEALRLVDEQAHLAHTLAPPPPLAAAG